MIRRTILLAIFASPLAAQEFKVDEQVVAGCFASAEPGEFRPACIGEAATRCQSTTPGGESTLGMGSCTSAEAAIWDRFLNLEYQDLRAQMREMDADEFAGDVSRADALRDAQRAWIAFRDAECAFNWAMFQEGTIRTVVGTGCILDMTATRALELRGYREIPG